MGTGNQGLLSPVIENTSEKFKLVEDVARVQIIGLSEGDCVCVETEVCIDECNTRWIPYSPSCCGQQCFSYPQNQLYLPVPNTYRLTLRNVDDAHIDDPSWFEDVEIYWSPIKSKNLESVLGGYQMSCGCKEETLSTVEANFRGGIPLQTHNDGEGTEVITYMPELKSNGVTIPLTFNPTTGNPCFNIPDKDTDTVLGEFDAGAVQANGDILFTAPILDVINGNAPTGETRTLTIPFQQIPVNIVCNGDTTQLLMNDGTLVDSGLPCPTLEKIVERLICFQGRIRLVYNDGTVADTAMICPEANSFGTAVENPDGSITVTFPDGTTATNTPTVDTDTNHRLMPKAPVFNADGTVTVCFDLVDVNDNNAVLAADVFCHDTSMPESPDSSMRVSADGCLHEFLDEDGNVTYSFVKRDEAQAHRGFVQVSGGQLDDADLAALPNNTWVDTLTITEEVTNPSDCRDMEFLAVARQGQVRMASLANSENDFRVRMVPNSSTPLDFLFPEVRYQWEGDDDADTQVISFSPGIGVTEGTIAPNTTVTLSYIVQVRVANYVADPINSINLNQFRIAWLGVLV